MKIVHIQYRMPAAGNACFRLHKAMCEHGIDSSVLTIVPSIKRDKVYSKRLNFCSLILKVYNYLHSKIISRLLKDDVYFYSYIPIFGRKLTGEQLVREADVIYFHWIAGGSVSLNEIKKIAATGKPIIFFMHDMWDFTGGCHHSFECDKYKIGCKDCDMFRKHNKIAQHQAEKKRKIFSQFPNIVFISPSIWMAKCAKSSYALKSNIVYVVNNLVDETNFKPIDKRIAREILNLPLDKIIITFGCQAGTNNPFKGWSYLQDAMSKIHNSNIHILIYGSDYNPETAKQIKFPITFLGPVFDETKLSLICNSTDIFVSPSLAESFGLTFLENNLCGIPVVGFNNSAIGEIVKTGITGYLANNKDSNDLAQGITYLISNKLSVFTRNTYSSDEIIKQHLSILKSLTKQEEE